MTESLFCFCAWAFSLLQHGRPLRGRSGFVRWRARRGAFVRRGGRVAVAGRAQSACAFRLHMLRGRARAWAVGLFSLNWAVFGDWLRFSEYQAQHWGQKLGFF